MSIVTDSTPLEAPKDPAGSTILALYRLFATPAEVAQMEAEFRAGGVGYGHFKQRLFEAMWELLRADARAPRRAGAGPRLRGRGAAPRRRACARAWPSQTMQRVRTAVGLR